MYVVVIDAHRVSGSSVYCTQAFSDRQLEERWRRIFLSFGADWSPKAKVSLRIFEATSVLNLVPAHASLPAPVCGVVAAFPVAEQARAPRGLGDSMSWRHLTEEQG